MLTGKLNKETAIAFFKGKYDDAIELVEGFINRKTGNYFAVINRKYIVSEITPEAYNPFMRNKNFKTRISAKRITSEEYSYLTIEDDVIRRIDE